MPVIDIYGTPVEFPDSLSEQELQSAAAAAAAQLAPKQGPASPAQIPAGKYTVDTLPTPSPSRSLGKAVSNVVGGLVRGAGSIGATIVSPGDMFVDAVKGDRGPNVAGLVSGQQPMSRNQERRANIDAGLTSLLGSDPNSGGYQTGKLLTEVAGTMGVGGALANGVRAVAPAAAPLAEAIATGGMRTGNNLANAGRAAKALDMGTRVVGGAVTGGAATGLVDPKSAGLGAVVGGALPPALQAANVVGKVARGIVSGPAVPEAKRMAVEQARQAGYVIPPTQAKPTLVNRALEGAAGKLTTAQNASARNQPVTNRLAAQELGLPADAEITPEALSVIRKQAGQSYEAVSNTGTVVPGKPYEDALDKIAEPFRKASAGFPNAKPPAVIADIESLKTQEFDAGAGIAKISELRDLADEAYRNGRKNVGKAYKEAAEAIENAIDRHLVDIQAPSDLLSAYRSARQTIAKTYTVEKALNPTTGTIDAKKLGAELKKGKPLTGGLRQIGAFANEFEKAVQVPEKMGSLPQISPLDFASVGAISAATQKPGVLGALLGRPIARGIALSGPVQNRLAAQQSPGLLEMLTNPQVQELAYRSAPVAISR